VLFIFSTGYGNQSPTTGGGRIFVIFFALLGIPLTGLMLVGVGDKMKSVVFYFQKKNYTEYHRTESTVKHTLLHAVIIGLLILLPAGIFHTVEDWTYGESLYYCFITLFTIGFGDFVVGK
jgi:ABC-type spermidine/putrescine transport system permease subunit II